MVTMATKIIYIQAKVMSVTEELSSMATEVSALRSEVRRLTCESVKERERVEMDKRQALEKSERESCLYDSCGCHGDGAGVERHAYSYMKIPARG